MVVGDFDVVGMAILPAKTDPVLVIDPDTVLSRSISSQSLQAVTGWNTQLSKLSHPVELRQLPPDHRPKGDGASAPGPSGPLAVEQILGGTIREGAYHGIYYNACRDTTEAPPCRAMPGS